MTRGSGFGVRRLAIVQVKPTNAQKTRHFESRHHMLFFIPIIPFRFIGTWRIGPNKYDGPVISHCGYPFMSRSPILCCH